MPAFGYPVGQYVLRYVIYRDGTCPGRELYISLIRTFCVLALVLAY